MADFFPPAPPATNDSVPVPPPVTTPESNLPPEQTPAPDNFAPIAPKDQNPNQKKLLIIIGVAVGAIILIAIIAWLLYQNLVWNKDEKILTDAWHKMFTFETLTIDGKLEGEVTEQSYDEDEPSDTASFSSEFSGTISDAGQGVKANLNFTQTEDQVTNQGSVEGEARRFTDNDIFFLVTGLEDFLNSMTANQSEAYTSLMSNDLNHAGKLRYSKELQDASTFTKPFDNTWIHFNPDTQEIQDNDFTSGFASSFAMPSDDLQNCIQQKTTALRTDKVAQAELAQVLNESLFFTATRLKDTQKHEGKTAYLYDISVEPKNALALSKALLQTQIYAQIKECDADSFTRMEKALNNDQWSQMVEVVASVIRPFLPKTTLWISQATHEPVRMEFDFDFNMGTSINVTAFANFHLNQQVALTKPTQYREYEEVNAEFELARTMDGEIVEYLEDQELLALAYKTARVVENYDLHYGSFPWGGDPYIPYFQYLRVRSYDENNWLNLITDSTHGLTSPESISLQNGSFYLFKPRGQIDTIYTYVCFIPSSISFQEVAAERCMNSAIGIENLDLCHTKDGTIPAKNTYPPIRLIDSNTPLRAFDGMIAETYLTGIHGNLICVSNDGTTLDVPLKPEVQQYAPKKYQYYLDNIAGADLSANVN